MPQASDGSEGVNPLSPGFGWVISCSGELAFISSLLDGDPSRRLFFEDGTPVSAALIAELRILTRSLSIAARLERGEVLMVDNRRMLHGRTGYQDPDRAVLVRLSDRAF